MINDEETALAGAADTQPATPGDRLRSALRGINQTDRDAVLAWLASRASIWVVAGAVGWLFAANGLVVPLLDRWQQWDFHHFWGIALYGYGGEPTGVPNEAFFPGFPAVTGPRGRARHPARGRRTAGVVHRGRCGGRGLGPARRPGRRCGDRSGRGDHVGLRPGGHFPGRAVHRVVVPRPRLPGLAIGSTRQVGIRGPTRGGGVHGPGQRRLSGHRPRRAVAYLVGQALVRPALACGSGAAAGRLDDLSARHNR